MTWEQILREYDEREWDKEMSLAEWLDEYFQSPERL